MRRTFGFDALRCPTCDARMRVVSTLTDPDVVKKILAHLGMPTEPLPRARARDPTGQTDFGDFAGRTFLRPDRAKCLHYYFYFIDEELGLCFMRVSTWCPFGVQVYFNGHNVLAAKLRKAGIAYEMLDNAFTSISDWSAAQRLADEFETQALHARLDHYAHKFCPAACALGLSYQWNHPPDLTQPLKRLALVRPVARTITCSWCRTRERDS